MRCCVLEWLGSPLKDDNTVCANPVQMKKHLYVNRYKCLILKWAHLGSNQGPPDYESGALTN